MRLLIFFPNITFRKILSGKPSEYQTVWIKILSYLIWVQTVCKMFSADDTSRQALKYCKFRPVYEYPFCSGLRKFKCYIELLSGSQSAIDRACNIIKKKFPSVKYPGMDITPINSSPVLMPEIMQVHDSVLCLERGIPAIPRFYHFCSLKTHPVRAYGRHVENMLIFFAVYMFCAILPFIRLC